MCIAPKSFAVVFENKHGHVFCLLLKEAFLYASADWLSSSVCQRVATGQFGDSSKYQLAVSMRFVKYRDKQLNKMSKMFTKAVVNKSVI